MATPADPIAIARDIAQESCLRIRMTDSEPERISQRQSVHLVRNGCCGMFLRVWNAV